MDNPWLVGIVCSLVPNVLGWVWAHRAVIRATWVPLSQSEYIELMSLGEDAAVDLAESRGYRHDWLTMQWMKRRCQCAQHI